MSKLVRRVGNFFLDQAAKQYERSMTRKLNAFGERNTGAGGDDAGSAVAAASPALGFVVRAGEIPPHAEPASDYPSRCT